MSALEDNTSSGDENISGNALEDNSSGNELEDDSSVEQAEEEIG